MGIVSPIGCGEDAFWASLLAGRHAAAPVTGFDTTDLPRSIACQVRDPIPAAEGMGRASALAVEAARSALRSAGLEAGDLRLCHALIVMGTTMGETEF
ncbi:MAG: beta-ketoacyl-[acyl-carrier-protein] synthase family protein, partial [Planctomycetota bacterium]